MTKEEAQQVWAAASEYHWRGFDHWWDESHPNLKDPDIFDKYVAMKRTKYPESDYGLISNILWGLAGIRSIPDEEAIRVIAKARRQPFFYERAYSSLIDQLEEFLRAEGWGKDHKILGVVGELTKEASLNPSPSLGISVQDLERELELARKDMKRPFSPEFWKYETIRDLWLEYVRKEER